MPALSARHDDANLARGRQAAKRLFDLRVDLGRGDHDLRAGVLHDVRELARVEQEEHRDDGEPGAPDGRVGHEHLGAVRHHEDDLVALAAAEIEKRLGEAAARVVELPIGERLSFEDQPLVLPVLGEVLLRERGEVHVRLPFRKGYTGLLRSHS